MGLKTRVFVSDVDNLGDGRYCAGMGVEMIGFPIEEDHPRFVSAEKFKEISSWLAGIKFAGEIYSHSNVDLSTYDAIESVLTDNPALVKDLTGHGKTLIYKIKVDSFDAIEQQMAMLEADVDTFILEFDNDLSAEDLNKIKTLTEEYKIIVSGGFDEDSINNVLDNATPEGIALKGGSEVSIGVNTFDGLVEVLEAIETDEWN
ncbi:beta/alpha barrel domain-containing protein [Flammeovirga pacifica]|uniref:Phosphoribosylanthranilate isomerase n=1 Tax=Flammeovirga pacifica TaxID=915059 RepID=A0A1S1YZ34_FLAPC|nr:hypothetical protein [Flammeovirga pacifica]OHX66276.1 hypothetical protein NH26_07870 [Flammeovirga pacifica]